MIMTSPTPTIQRPPASVAQAGPDGAELVNRLATLPLDDPSRAALRERTIEAWLPLVHHLVHRYTGRGEPFDDLFQVATIGLIKAVDRFDPRHEVEFVGFAVPTILGEMKRHFRDRTWFIRVPRRLQELRIAISRADGVLSHLLGRSPRLADIAAYLDITEDEVVEGLEGRRAYGVVSLSAPATSDGSRELGDTIGDDDENYHLAELRLALGPAMATLDEREQRILTLRFYGNQTQAQIGEQLGVSQMQISRLLSRALTKLRAHLDPDERPEEPATPPAK